MFDPENENTETTEEMVDVSDLPDEVKAEIDGYTEEQPEEAPEQEETSPAEADSEIKTETEVIEKPKGKVPYSRFKEQVDKAREYETEIARLKSELESQKKAPVRQESNTEHTEYNISGGLKLNKQVLEKMDAAARESAKSMLGWSDEDVDALDYADDSDEKAVMWNQALAIARNNVQSEIRHAIIAQQRQQQEFINQHQQLVKDFNSYYSEQAKEADFKEIQQHAQNLLSTVSPFEQAAVRDAYARVNNNTASPQDIYCVKSFFQRAKHDYRSQQSNHPADLRTNKIKQAEKFPRASQVGGSASTEAMALTPQNLEYMLSTMDWDDIPDEVKNLLLGASIRG